MTTTELHDFLHGRNGGSLENTLPCSRARVLSYHRVVPPGSRVRPGSRTLTAGDFRRHLELLEKWGFTPITLLDHSLIRAGELLPPRKPIIITFTGGYADFYENAFPVLQEFGMHAVVFVTADPARRLNGWEVENPDGSAPLMGPEELLHLHDAGFEIGSLTMTHPALPHITRDEAWDEILHSRMRLEGLLNAPVRSFAYPYGLYNATLKSLVKDAGYLFACTTWSGAAKFLGDPYAIRRIDVSDALDPVQFGLKVRAPQSLRALTVQRADVPSHPSQARTLLLVSGGLGFPELEEMRRREEADLSPRRSLLLSTLHADVADERFLASAPPLRHLLYRMLPLSVAQLLETSIVGGRYDAIVSWAERLGIPYAVFLKLTGTRFPHVGIFSWISRPKKSILLKFARSRFDRVVLMSSRQRDFALQKIGLAPEKIAFLRWPVDQKFWRPDLRPTDMICAVGREMRDYGTLIEAVRGTGIPCHIAAGGQGSIRKKDPWISALANPDRLPVNVTIGPKDFCELRELYRRSRFVVMPLFPTKTDNGTTTILEAMAMGKAVICSRVEGQRDVIRDGETGIFVPPGDPLALRRAIDHLWSHPEEAERIGTAARAYVEQNHSLDAWVSAVREAVNESIIAHRSRKFPPSNGDRHVS